MNSLWPCSTAHSVGSVCLFSSVMIMVALTSDRLISSSASVVKKSALTSSASWRPSSSLMSHNPSHLTPGYSRAYLARILPMVPQPMIANPISLTVSVIFSSCFYLLLKFQLIDFTAFSIYRLSIN